MGDVSENRGDPAVVTLSLWVEMVEKLRAVINILSEFFLMIIKCLVVFNSRLYLISTNRKLFNFKYEMAIVVSHLTVYISIPRCPTLNV